MVEVLVKDGGGPELWQVVPHIRCNGAVATNVPSITAPSCHCCHTGRCWQFTIAVMNLEISMLTWSVSIQALRVLDLDDRCALLLFMHRLTKQSVGPDPSQTLVRQSNHRN